MTNFCLLYSILFSNIGYMALCSVFSLQYPPVSVDNGNSRRPNVRNKCSTTILAVIFAIIS